MSGPSDAAISQMISQILGTIHDPVSGKPLTEAGLIRSIRNEDGHVLIVLEVNPKNAKQLEETRRKAERAVADLPGIATCNLVLTAERENEKKPARAQRRAGGAASGQPLELPGIHAIVTVASGKGGVGKSTTAMNLALALAAQGKKVGVLDADIYGPSIPQMAGVPDRKPHAENGRMQAIEAHGLKVMSIGFMVDPHQPVIWRGPMVMGALEQLLKDVDWGALDILLVDMPPGTGDAQLTMAQRVPVTGAVIVSTPQDIALLDARKGLNMFRQVNIPVLGFVENMSYHKCSNCGHVEHVFDHGGARKAAEELGVPFLGEIPLDIRIRLCMDGGKPLAAADPESPHTKAYDRIASRLWTTVEAIVKPKKSKGLFPKISVR